MKKYICFMCKAELYDCLMPKIYDAEIDFNLRQWKPIKEMNGYKNENIIYHLDNFYSIGNDFEVYNDYTEAKKWFDKQIENNIERLNIQITRLEKLFLI